MPILTNSNTPPKRQKLAQINKRLPNHNEQRIETLTFNTNKSSTVKKIYFYQTMNPRQALQLQLESPNYMVMPKLVRGVPDQREQAASATHHGRPCREALHLSEHKVAHLPLRRRGSCGGGGGRRRAALLTGRRHR